MDFKIDFVRVIRTPYSEVYELTLVGDKGEVHIGTLHLHYIGDGKSIFLYIGSEYMDHFTKEEDPFKIELLSKIYEIADGSKGFSEFTIEFTDHSIDPIIFTWDELQESNMNNSFFDMGLIEGE